MTETRIASPLSWAFHFFFSTDGIADSCVRFFAGCAIKTNEGAPPVCYQPSKSSEYNCSGTSEIPVWRLFQTQRGNSLTLICKSRPAVLYVAKLQEETDVIVKFEIGWGTPSILFGRRIASALLCCALSSSNWKFVVTDWYLLRGRKWIKQWFVINRVRLNFGSCCICPWWSSWKQRNVSFMNTEIAWPSGAESGKFFRSFHDVHWLEVMCRRLLLYSSGASYMYEVTITHHEIPPATKWQPTTVTLSRRVANLPLFATSSMQRYS